MSHPLRSRAPLRLAGALCATSALLAASLGAAAAPNRHAAAGPVSGGTLRVGYTEDYVTFDPAEASGIDEGTLYATLYSGLYQYDKNNQPQLDLAAAPPTITDNAKVWTFKIRKGVKFSNGMELTANDLKYSMLRVLSPKLVPISYAQQNDNIFVGSDAYIKGKASDVPGIQVLDPYTIRFKLTDPLPLLPNILGKAYNMVVPQAVVSKESQQQFADNPIGSGPFTLQSWQKGVQAVFIKNPQYYRAGQPYLDKIIFSLNISTSVLALKVQHGDLDGFAAGFEVAPADLRQMSSDPKYASYIVHNSPNVAIWLDLNAADPVMKSPALREAIAMAIDRTRLVQLDGGSADPLYQLYLPSYPQFDPTLANKAVYPYAPQNAISLVKQSGYKGQPLIYMDRSGVPYFQAIAPGIQQQLQQIGLNVTIDTVGRLPYHVVREQLTGHAMDPFDWGISYSDALDTYELNMSCTQAGDGGFSGSHYCDPKVDALAAQAMALPQGPAQNALWRQAQLRVLRSATKIPLMYPHNTDIFNTGKVGGFVYVPTEGPLYQYMWLK
ncbi:MAG TPA: ABC transporter substrate-binding protein [Chloroflexota bacterium]|nr:ABC transporter substrate-binding protein [Chloroflexota bacterium]